MHWYFTVKKNNIKKHIPIASFIATEKRLLCDRHRVIFYGILKLEDTLTLSLPNATVVEITVHGQTRLQSKFKGAFDSCLFLTVIWDANICVFISKCSGDIVVSYMEGFANFCSRIDFTKSVCKVIRFRGCQK